MIYLWLPRFRDILPIFLFIAFLVCFSEVKSQASGQAYYPESSSAAFHESPNKDGAIHSYRHNTMGWTNIGDVLTRPTGEDINPALLCVSGVWLLYGEPNYQLGQSDSVNLLSGNENCIDPEQVSMGSIQPVSNPVFSVSGSIALFMKSNFGSLAKLISAEESAAAGVTQLYETVSPIGSIVAVGDTIWSLISVNGQIMCVRPEPKTISEGSTPICYAANLLKVQIKDFQINAVSPDCPIEEDDSLVATLRLTDCIEYGLVGPTLLKSSKSLGRSLGDGNAVKMECRTPTVVHTTRFSQEESDEIKRLLNIRLNHDFLDSEQLLWPDNREDIWKTLPLDTAFEIMTVTVPKKIVNVEYLSIIREFTVYHLNEVWKSKNSTEKAGKMRNWKSHKIITHLMDKCLRTASRKREHYESLIAASYNEKGTLETMLEKINPAFVMNSDYDPVIETAWVVANYVMAVCHETFSYQVNFWDNFVTAFRYLYFAPLATRWRSPAITPQAFRIILSGFGSENQYKRIAFAASEMLKLTPNLQPFEGYETSSSGALART